MLGRIRRGFVTQDNVHTLEAKTFPFKGDTIDDRMIELCDKISLLLDDALCLFPTRNMCNALNIEMLKKLQSGEIELVADDTNDCSSKKMKKTIEKK